MDQNKFPTYWMRCCISNKYPKLTSHVFAIGHYKRKEDGEDEFSKKINHFYLYGYYFDEILKLVLDMFDTHFSNDSISFDVVTLSPTSEKGQLRNSMKKLVESICKKENLKYSQILERNRDVKKSHEIKTSEERYENIKDSIDVTEDVSEKTILVIDNVSTTGYTLLEIANTLRNKGAKLVLFICLGISIKGEKTDYYLDRDKKVSWFISKFKSPKLSKEEREKWKREKS